ncbi:inositol monophosphatase family protein [Micromonospora sp. NPDC005161]
MDGADDLRLAFDASDLAAGLALTYFESGVSATLKADGTPVTEADRAVEQLFRETLSGARPKDALLGEVSTTSVLADARLDALDDASRARLPPGVAHAPASPLPLVELVRGEIDAFLVERYHIWDHAPWISLVEEAGGRFTDRTGGQAGDQGSGLCSNANVHSQLLTALRYPRRGR